jgi:DNA-entry nuclease
MVFVNNNSGKYYSMVTNPRNYSYMSQADADASGFVRAARGNQYAKP